MPLMSEGLQLLWLFVLAAPVACVAWTVTHEDLFMEVREWCLRKCEKSKHFCQRKFFYLFTCEYCFSHYVAGGVVWLTGYRLLIPDWRGALLAWFTLVWVANVYMSLFGRLRLDIKRERVEIKAEEEQVELKEVTPLPVKRARQESALSAGSVLGPRSRGARRRRGTPLNRSAPP